MENIDINKYVDLWLLFKLQTWRVNFICCGTVGFVVANFVFT